MLPPQIPQVRLLQGQILCHAHTDGYLQIPDIEGDGTLGSVSSLPSGKVKPLTDAV